ncbi:CaiB/BaiF CoA transferase family protein [Cupriavidus metallidurans]|uniref:CaiB/BaiF CoA transferase family protein n=1 Tax=Cupriavidus metallidurans TaxID=119219 RepID=UPI000CE03416|nr:CaiB/BaiF CoA-transferase family protein [Cupriavidus metallidurans]AVA38164.1 CoA transferase [Cupriavidus metallidurans]
MLSGVKIVEICGIGPGPFCAMHLADLGADVIAIERPVGANAPAGKGNVLNRGKRSVVADLKTEAGRELVLRLVESADALIEGMRPGVMERMGLGPEACQARNPRLVYGRMTGWGQSGPLAQAAGHDNNYIALSGALYYNGAPTAPPSSAFTVVGDIGGGALYLEIGLLVGILRARATGKGTVVDAAIVDGSAHMLQLLLATQRKGYISGERGSNIHDSSHFYSTYRCADGNFITVGAIEPQFYALLLEKLGLSDDARFAAQWDRGRWPALHHQLTEIFASKTRDEWCAMLESTDVCFGPVLSPEEAARHPHNMARGVYFERDGQIEAAPAPRFDDNAGTAGIIPHRGEHTEQITNAVREKRTKNLWL